MGLTKAGIILAAEQNCARDAGLDTIAGNRLDMILDELYENYTFDFLSKEPAATITLTAGSQTWTVPSDYLKFQIMVLVRSDLNASNPPNIVLPKMDFTDFQTIRTPLQTGTPQKIALNRTFTDVLSPGVTGYIYPVPDITYTARLAYYYKPTYSIGTSIEPAFPDTALLVELLTNALLGMGYGKSELKRKYDPNLMEKVIGRYRRNQVDNGIYPAIAKLDGQIGRASCRERV